ncbi:MAG: glutamyl-tRNA synthetase [Thermoanaerobaculia bacterium]|jgi:nondiscriminating glutamyl-tRNA synthetase|nr:glutamyl-tRNA synthetase [Thermoanaerobaculia bacterium]
MIRVRFAPSPTGHLHVGGARTAIFNWLFAKHHGGVFIIRVEDTDQARSTAESETMVLNDLRWLGLMWDEGPDIGGPHAPYRQSERVARYGDVARELIARGIAYRCYCTEEELEAKRKIAEAESRPPHYDLTCWLNRRDDESLPHAIRFHVPDDGDVTIDDAIRGEVTWKRESLGDFILVRSDGLPTYNFSVVVDDHDMEITNVIRAEEHLTNTHRQVLVYRAMEWAIPQFAHVSLILGQDRTKLSKRHGATSVAAYAEAGFLAEAMVNYLTLLGWSAPDGRDVFDRDYAIANFALDRVNSAPAVFDPQKFEWLNGQYIHSMSATELRPLVVNAIGFDAPWLEEAIDVVKTSVHLLPQFKEMIRFVTDYTAPEIDREFAFAVANDLREHGAPLDADAVKAMNERLKKSTGRKGKELFMPLRLMLTGMDHGPELVRAIPLLERASESDPRVLSPLARTDKCIEQC